MIVPRFKIICQDKTYKFKRLNFKYLTPMSSFEFSFQYNLTYDFWSDNSWQFSNTSFFHDESILHNSWMVSFWASVTQFIKCVKMAIYLFGRHTNMTLRNVMSVINDKYIFMIEMFFISAWLAKLTNSEFCIFVIYIWSNAWK